jgi:hypothetical protein
MAVKWARQFYPEMGEMELQRAFGGYREYSPKPREEHKPFNEDVEKVFSDIVRDISPGAPKAKEEITEEQEEEDDTDDKEIFKKKETREKNETREKIESVETKREEPKPTDRKLTKAELRNLAIKEKMLRLRERRKQEKEKEMEEVTKEEGATGEQKKRPRRRV